MKTDILHIVLDNPFIDELVHFMNDVNGQHLFVCYVKSKPIQYSYIKNETIIAETYKEIESRIKCGEYRSIMFHYIYSPFYELTKSVPLDKIVIFSTWGKDLYEASYFGKSLIPMKLYKSKTLQLIRTYQQSISIPFKKRLKVLIKNILKIDLYRQRKFYKRVDYIATVLPSEYIILKRRLQLRAKYLPFQYVNNVCGKYNYVNQHAQYILVGNSSDPSNNHLDILALLNKRNITQKLYFPLAYGDEDYKNHIMPLLPCENAMIQTDYMPLAEYSELLSQCRVAIFGHIRQQALYNVNRMLLQGSKVFFYKDSIVYNFYKSRGVYVYNLEDDLYQSQIDTLLTKEQMDKNYAIVSNLWNYDMVKGRFYNYVKSENIL